MKTLLIVTTLLTTLLTGCAQVAGNTPSLQYCSEVDYHRVGNEIEVTAKCQAPIGQSLLH